MKSKEEIEKLAEHYFSDPYICTGKEGFIEGYTQCQEDMADKKYTEKDMENAFQNGWLSREPQYDGGWKTTMTFIDYINSLNKQD